MILFQAVAQRREDNAEVANRAFQAILKAMHGVVEAKPGPELKAALTELQRAASLLGMKNPEEFRRNVVRCVNEPEELRRLRRMLRSILGPMNVDSQKLTPEVIKAIGEKLEELFNPASGGKFA